MKSPRVFRFVWSTWRGPRLVTFVCPFMFQGYVLAFEQASGNRVEWLDPYTARGAA